MIGAFVLAIVGGVIIGLVFGFFLGIQAAQDAIFAPDMPMLPRMVPQVIRNHRDRIQRTVFTPKDYHPGPGWTYYPEHKEWRRGARY